MTAIIGLLDTCNDSKGTFSNDYGAHRTDIVVSRQGAASRLSSAVTADVVPRLHSLPLIGRAAGVLRRPFHWSRGNSSACRRWSLSTTHGRPPTMTRPRLGATAAVC